jgi:ferredoxin
LDDGRSMGQDKQLELQGGGSRPEPAAESALDSSYFLPLTGGPPHEAGDDRPQAPAHTPEETYRLLMDFFLYGIRPGDRARNTEEFRVVPALTYPYCDLSRIRHDFPFCLDRGGEPATAVQTLTGIIDGLIAQIEISGDEGEILKQQVYRLESEIRRLAEHEHEAGILGLWDRAARNLLDDSHLDEDKKILIRDNLAAVRKALTSDYEMITCDAKMPQRLLTALMESYWDHRCEDWRGELDALIQHLADILEADFSHSPEAKSAEHLRESSGAHGDHIDFSAFSTILAASRPASQIPENRRERIRAALDMLLRVKPLYAPTHQADAAEPPFPVSSTVADCETALQTFDTRMAIMVDFFKAVQIARLECNNAYRDSVHDDYYNRFDVTYLTEDEMRLCPPVFVKLEQDAVATNSFAKLLETLNSGYPIKVLLLIDDLCEEARSTDQTAVVIDWSARLANMVMAMPDVYVMQATVANLGLLHAGFLSGLEYGGSALLSVYAGNRRHRPELPVFLDASSAIESRIFPAFTCDPSRGPDLADRFEVGNNTQADQSWPVESFRYLAADGNENAIDTGFTAADFLLNDHRLAQHFWNVSPGLWHEKMAPLHEYLQFDPAAATGRIPYILTVDQGGEVGRALLSRSIVASVIHCAGAWRYLQELGGVNNSHALRLLAAEKSRLAEEKQREVATIEDNYRALMEQDIGRLTQEIVGRIAQQLIREPGVPMPEMPPATRQPVPAPPPPGAGTEVSGAAAPEPAEEEEDEELEGLDDPYIVTQLCTSCNDCMNINKDLFGYDNDKRAYIKDPGAGTYEDLVLAAEKCPVHIIHPGKPRNPDEPGLEDLLKRAAPYL